MAKGRVYTQEQYDDAIRRISSLIDIEKVQSIRELDARLRQEELLQDVTGGFGTIYKQLVENWKDFVKPDVLIDKEMAVRRVSKRLRRQQIREINRIQGIAYLDQQNRLSIRKASGEVRRYIKHNGYYYREDNIVIQRYSRTNKKTGEVVQRWVTRLKPKKEK